MIIAGHGRGQHGQRDDVRDSERHPVTRRRTRWRDWRTRGVMATLRAIIGRCYRSHRFIVTRFELGGPPVADHVGDIVFRLATAEDLDRLDELERYGRGSRQRAYVEADNDWLFVACHGTRIVATRRYSRTLPGASRDGHGLIPRVVALGPRQVWSADGFVLPAFRRRGIPAHFGPFTMRFLASLGYTEQLAAIELRNLTSLRSSHRRGGQRIFYVSYVRLLFYERLYASKAAPRSFRAALTASTPGVIQNDDVK